MLLLIPAEHALAGFREPPGSDVRVPSSAHDMLHQPFQCLDLAFSHGSNHTVVFHTHVEQVCPSVTHWPATFVLPLQVITLQNASSAAEPIRLVQRAPGFRLFATQNPNAGWFKGRREPLSHALINRFVPVVFQQLPAEEWEQVVAAQLTAGGMVVGPAAVLAAQLVSFHTAIQTACGSKSFPEVCANSSNRFMTFNGTPQQHNQLSCCNLRCRVCYLLPVTCVTCVSRAVYLCTLGHHLAGTTH
jgi:hypothetical protein